MSMMRSKYDANGTPSGAKEHKEMKMPRHNERKDMKGEGRNMENRMKKSFERREADEPGRSKQSGCME